MPNPNMTYQELRKHILCITGECPPEHANCTYDPTNDGPSYGNQTPLTDKLIQLFATLCAEVIGEDEIEGNSGWLRQQVKIINEIKGRQRAKLAQLSTKNTEGNV